MNNWYRGKVRGLKAKKKGLRHEPHPLNIAVCLNRSDDLRKKTGGIRSLSSYLIFT
jgi:hypothetical protein